MRRGDAESRTIEYFFVWSNDVTNYLLEGQEPTGDRLAVSTPNTQCGLHDVVTEFQGIDMSNTVTGVCTAGIPPRRKCNIENMLLR
jgi:hypothetical protein